MLIYPVHSNIHWDILIVLLYAYYNLCENGIDIAFALDCELQALD